MVAALVVPISCEPSQPGRDTLSRDRATSVTDIDTRNHHVKLCHFGWLVLFETLH